MINETLREHLNAQLFGAPDNQAYAIIDGTATSGLLPRLNVDSGQHRCLYRGELSTELQTAAPYLVTLKRHSHLGEWLLNSWGHHQSIYAIVPGRIEFDAVYKHFRSLLIATNSDNNKSLYFRYYDPRTLRRYLTRSTAVQTRKVFGPVQFYLLESPQDDPQDNTIQRYWEDDTGVKHAPLTCSEPDTPSSGPFGDSEQTLSQEELVWRAQHAQTHQRLAQCAREQGTTKGRLIISLTQMQQQRLREETDFIQWYIDDYLPENLPDISQAFPPKDLKIMIKNGRKEALKQGFTDPASQVHFVTLMWQLGPNFHHFSGFKEIINADQASEAERIDQLYQVNAAQWDNARQNSNDHYWHQEAIR